jgi:hypothetical protein
MKQLQIVSKFNQATRATGIHVVNAFISSYVQQYETQGATEDLLQSLSLLLIAKYY